MTESCIAMLIPLRIQTVNNPSFLRIPYCVALAKGFGKKTFHFPLKSGPASRQDRPIVWISRQDPPKHTKKFGCLRTQAALRSCTDQASFWTLVWMLCSQMIASYLEVVMKRLSGIISAQSMNNKFYGLWTLGISNLTSSSEAYLSCKWMF